MSDRIDGCTTILTKPVSKLAKRKKYIARLAMASYIHGFWVAPEKIRGVCSQLITVNPILLVLFILN